jgi:hypothetical protein
MSRLRRAFIFANWVLLSVVVVGIAEAVMILTDCLGVRSRLLEHYSSRTINGITFGAVLLAGSVAAVLAWCGKLPGTRHDSPSRQFGGK